MKLRSVLLTSVSILAAISLKTDRYDGYRVYEIEVKNEKQVELLDGMENYPDGYRFLGGQIKLGNRAQLIVPPQKFEEFQELKEKFLMKTELISNNLQEMVDREIPSKSRRKSIGDWTTYWTLDEINEWMDSLVVDYPGVVTIFTVGKSYEGRDIRGVKINIGGGEKKSIFFESMIHSYEWIAPATTTWFINELLTSEDAGVPELSQRFEWYFLPVFNVDGYVYTWTTDRFWRKSRRPTKNLLCHGADLNRNWDVHFGESSAKNPCHSRYGGDFVFSEPETRQLSEFLKKIPRLVGYFTIHALGQYVMFPYAYSTEKIDTYDILYEIGQKGANIINTIHGVVYEFGALNEFFDPLLSGTSIDWVSINLKTNVTFSYELRPQRPYPSDKIESLGLLLPPDQIVEVAQEVYISILTILLAAIEKDFA